MQDQAGESFRMDWIESFEFGQEFEKLKRDWSTKFIPLWGLNFNRLNIELDFIFFCPILLAGTSNNISSSCSNNNNKIILTSDLSVETFGPRNSQSVSQSPDFTTGSVL